MEHVFMPMTFVTIPPHTTEVDNNKKKDHQTECSSIFSRQHYRYVQAFKENDTAKIIPFLNPDKVSFQAIDGNVSIGMNEVLGCLVSTKMSKMCQHLHLRTVPKKFAPRKTMVRYEVISLFKYTQLIEVIEWTEDGMIIEINHKKYEPRPNAARNDLSLCQKKSEPDTEPMERPHSIHETGSPKLGASLPMEKRKLTRKTKSTSKLIGRRYTIHSVSCENLTPISKEKNIRCFISAIMQPSGYEWKSNTYSWTRKSKTNCGNTWRNLDLRIYPDTEIVEFSLWTCNFFGGSRCVGTAKIDIKDSFSKDQVNFSVKKHLEGRNGLLQLVLQVEKLSDASKMLTKQVVMAATNASMAQLTGQQVPTQRSTALSVLADISNSLFVWSSSIFVLIMCFLYAFASQPMVFSV